MERRKHRIKFGIQEHTRTEQEQKEIMTDEYIEVTRKGQPRTLMRKKKPTAIEKGEVFYIDGVAYTKVIDGAIREYHVARSAVLQDSLDKADAAKRLKALEEK